MSQHKRIATIAFALAAFVVAALFGLDALARWQLGRHLRNVAANELALAAVGVTPFVWNFDDDEDLIAGRVFGAEEFEVDSGTLTIKAPAAPFEVALRLPRDIDVRRFNRLAYKIEAGRRGKFELLTRETLDGPQFSSKPIAVAPGKNLRTLHVTTLTWLDATAQPVAFGGDSRRAATLRLRMQFPAGTRVILHEVLLKRSPKVPRLVLASISKNLVHADAAQTPAAIRIYRLSSETKQIAVELRRLRELEDKRQTLVALSQAGRPELRLARRDQIRAALPDAIVVPEESVQRVLSEADRLVREGNGENVRRLLDWIFACLYAVLLLRLRFYLHPAKSTATNLTLEAVGAFLGPLVLVMGGMLGDNLSWPALIVLSAALAFALSLKRPAEALPLRLLGRPRAWRDPLLFATLAVAVTWWMAGADSPSTFPIAKLARYLGWALVQQYLICVVLAERFLLLTRGNKPLTVASCALLFALLHTPNAALMGATLIGGLVWSACYLRDRTLLPVALSHAISALALFMFSNPAWVRSAEISARFFL